MNEFEHDVTALEIIPSGGGVFEVDLDGAPVFSKKALGRHANQGEIVALLRAR